MRKIDFIFPIVAILVVLIVNILANHLETKRIGKEPNGNAVYYWRTSFYLNDYERNFLLQNNIKKIYLRFFDVDVNKHLAYNDKCAPVATTSFGCIPDDVEIIPVIFITPKAIKEYVSFSDNLVHRLYAMCQNHGIDIEEVQFDCDWTTSTRDDYFQFLKKVEPVLRSYFKKQIKISSTIRLHQLAQDPPEVAYGVLMCYNTGDFKDYETDNSILDVKDVKPYLKNLKKYNLPLALALPVYSWCVEFDKDKHFAQLNKSDYSVTDTTLFNHLKDNRYEMRMTYPKSPTHYVRYELPSAETILRVKQMVQKRNNMPVVLFHLDENQLSKYTEDEIKAFYM
mgnify:CR=1 FL=1